MHFFWLAGGLVTVVLGVANAPSVKRSSPDPIVVNQKKTDKAAKFEGRWIVVSGTFDGDEQDMQGDKVQLDNGKITIEEHNGDEQAATYKTDTSKNPNHIDFTPKQGKDKDKVFKGILILDEDRLTLCLARPGDDRPTEPSSKEGSGHILLVLEHAKSEN